MQITDLDNNQLDRVTDSVRAGTNNIRTIRINAIEAGFTLKCDSPVADVVIEGRVAGNVPWIDLEITGIDLTPFAGMTKNIEIRYTASDVYGGQPISDTNPFQSRQWDLRLVRQ